MRKGYDPKMDREKVPFPDGKYEDPQPLKGLLRDGSRRVFVISDTHLFHNRLWEVLRPTAEGGRDPRNTELILANWRRTVKTEDVVLHLGDVALGIPVADYRARIGWLPGEVWLVPGNHDRTPEKLAVFREMGWYVVKPFQIERDGWRVLFGHEPVASDVILPDQLNVHGHIHHNPAYSERYLNCCIEWLGYGPVELEPLLAGLIKTVGPPPAPREMRRALKKRRRDADVDFSVGL